LKKLNFFKIKMLFEDLKPESKDLRTVCGSDNLILKWILNFSLELSFLLPGCVSPLKLASLSPLHPPFKRGYWTRGKQGFAISSPTQNDTIGRIPLTDNSVADLKKLLKIMVQRNFLDFFMYFIQQCFICRPSDSTVSEDTEIELRTVATLALTVWRSNNSARSHHLIHII